VSKSALGGNPAVACNEAQSARISELSILRGGFVVGACVFGGQLLGFVRQAAVAYLLGTGPQADAVAVAFTPVELWWAVLSTTIIFGFGPLLTVREKAWSFADVARPVIGSSALAVVLLWLFTGPAVRVMAPGLAPEAAAAAERMLRIAALAVPALSISTLFTALLYSRRRFAFAAFHHGMVNMVTILTAIVLHARVGALGFAIGYTAGAWLQLAAAYAIARPALGRGQDNDRREGYWPLMQGPAYVLLYSLLIGLNPVVSRALASTFGTGATAAFDYSLKLVGVPLALLVNALSSSLLSEIASFRQQRDPRPAWSMIGKAAAVAATASTVMLAAMLLFGPWIVGLLFERGNFREASTTAVSAILLGFCPTLVFWGVLDVVSRSLLVLGKPQIPVLAAALALALNLFFSSVGLARSMAWTGTPAVIGFAAAAFLVVGYVLRSRSPWKRAP
jgi:putative peptidoglycan lipid II flippase